MSTYTHGPLKVLPEGRSIVVGQDYAPYDDVAEFFYAEEATVQIFHEEGLANAALFAAATDLLLACREVAACADSPFGPVYALERAMVSVRTAIAKAETIGRPERGA